MFTGPNAAWGVDLGASALKAVLLTRAKGGLQVEDFIVIPRERQPAGDAQDPASQPEARFIASAQRRRAVYVIGAPQAQLFTRFLSLPPVDEHRIPEIVRYEARQQIPFDLNEIVWAWQTVRPELVPGEEIEVCLMAIKNEVIAQHLAPMAPLKSALRGVAPVPLAVYNALGRDGQLSAGTVVLDIGAQETNLVLADGERYWLRSIPIGGNAFNEALEKRLSLKPEEAENVKLRMAESRHRAKLREILEPVLKDLVADTQRSIGYYKSLQREFKGESILLAGEGAKLDGLTDLFSAAMAYPVRMLTETRGIAYAGPADRAEEFRTRLPGLVASIGLAVQGLGEARVALDLRPPDWTGGSLLSVLNPLQAMNWFFGKVFGLFR